jgi:hypothetical protein
MGGKIICISTHKQDLTPEQIAANAKEAFAKMECAPAQT